MVRPERPPRGSTPLPVEKTPYPTLAALGNRPPPVSGEDTRARILQESLTLIAQQGAAATPLRQIARNLDISVAALYYYYPAKDQLLVDIAHPYLTGIDSIIQAAQSAPDRVEYIVKKLLDLAIAHPERTKIVEVDPAVHAHPLLGPILESRTRELHLLLSASDQIPGSDLLTQAVMGLLTRPVLRVPNLPPDQAHHHLVPAALRVLHPIRSLP